MSCLREDLFQPRRSEGLVPTSKSRYAHDKRLKINACSNLPTSNDTILTSSCTHAVKKVRMRLEQVGTVRNTPVISTTYAFAHIFGQEDRSAVCNVNHVNIQEPSA